MRFEENEEVSAIRAKREQNKGKRARMRMNGKFPH